MSKLLKRILADKDFISDQDDNDHWLIEKYMENITLEDILKDKKFLLKTKNVVRDLECDYMEYLEDTAELKPKPQSKNNYVGIELECFTRYDRSELFDKIVANGLEKMVQAVGDGSIEADFGDDCELRILLPEKDLSKGLKKVSKLLTKGKFGVNRTCGLHIHLDMRNRDVEACYARLLKFQDVLFGMVSSERWHNSYCHYTTRHNGFNRYVAINKENAYESHKTIEIRLHHATLDMKRIEQWVQLLLRVIATKTPPPKATHADVIKWGRKQKGLNHYISKNFDDGWSKEKAALGGGDWDL